MKFFVVDDSDALRQEFVRQLAELPHVTVVGEATCVADAVAGIAATLPDVVTLDIQLATGTGIEVLAAVRHVYPDMTIIVLTNYAQPQYRTRCLAAGADFFFDKSNEFEKAVALCGSLGLDSDSLIGPVVT